jgi:hypothetical protein
MTDIRVTREGLEALTNLTTSPVSRITRVGVEVLSNVIAGDFRLTRMGIEVLTTLEATPPVGGTANRQLWVNLL